MNVFFLCTKGLYSKQKYLTGPKNHLHIQLNEFKHESQYLVHKVD